ncbi:Protein FAM73A, partial [Sciurus carolinensis]|nr:Protein FAM73A [Sciurus carolinensis]
TFFQGGPGSGKGTQCEKLVEKYGFTHLSTGELLRNELASTSERSKLIRDIMERGDLVPSIRDPHLVICMDCSADTMTNRLLQRNQSSPRIDDTSKTIAKRLETYYRASIPVIAYYETKTQLRKVQSVNSCHSCACGNSNSWDKADEDDVKLVNIPVTTPENLYLMGMELFEEALRRWEQALTFRSRQAEDETCGSIKLGAGDAIAEESVDDIISTEFIHKLEALLQRAYRLQEEFEATLGGSDPNSLANDTDKDTDITVKGNVEDFGLRDTSSVASADSFTSVAELTEHREIRHTYNLESFCHCPFYEEAMHLVEEGKIYSRVLRTEMLECLGDSDFLAKLHCIRQAFQVILSETANRIFLAESGRKILSALIVKARKVKNLNFYDVVLDFILMDSFEDLENPPTSIQNVVNNRWLNSSFKETNQVLFFLKDIFDFEKVRYSSIETLTEDLMQLLIRRMELLMAYLGADALRHTSSCISGHGHVMSSGLLEAKVQ